MGDASDLTISECGNYGSVAVSSESGNAGGMVGETTSLTITNCTNYAASITGQYAGYLAGYADGMTWGNFNNSGNENQSGNSDLEEYGFLDEM